MSGDPRVGPRGGDRVTEGRATGSLHPTGACASGGPLVTEGRATGGPLSTAGRAAGRLEATDVREARAAWSALVEPGDVVAGALVSALGPVEAWAWVGRAVRYGVDDALLWLRSTDAAGRVGDDSCDTGGTGPGTSEGVGSRSGPAAPCTSSTGLLSTTPAERRPASVAVAVAHAAASRPSATVQTAVSATETTAGAGPGARGGVPRWGELATGGAGRARLIRAVARWAPRLAVLDVRRRLATLDALGGTFLVPGDPGWPAQLDDLGAAAPFGLWLRGAADLAGAAARCVGVVGARASTTYGDRVAHDLAAGLADRDVLVVSGGAFGIDAAAHRGALARAGVTTVVLAGGVDRAYPAGNARLLEAAVAEGGALVSEVPVGSAPTRARFLQRNRLIAALGGTTVVVEAAWRSGAISTAHHAAGLLRPVGAFPGPVTSAASAGCHRLLRDGVAVCVTDTAEVLELAGLAGPAPDRGPGVLAVGDDLPEHARRVLDGAPLRSPLDVVGVAAASGVSVDEARGALGLLELVGLVRRVGTGWVRAAV